MRKAKVLDPYIRALERGTSLGVFDVIWLWPRARLGMGRRSPAVTKESVAGHMAILAEGCRRLRAEMTKGYSQKVRLMASSLHNYPAYILGGYYMRDQFFENHLMFYERIMGEPFLGEYRDAFAQSDNL
jgi:hypothetical protein